MTLDDLTAVLNRVLESNEPGQYLGIAFLMVKPPNLRLLDIFQDKFPQLDTHFRCLITS